MSIHRLLIETFVLKPGKNFLSRFHNAQYIIKYRAIAPFYFYNFLFFSILFFFLSSVWHNLIKYDNI